MAASGRSGGRKTQKKNCPIDLIEDQVRDQVAAQHEKRVNCDLADFESGNAVRDLGKVVRDHNGDRH